MSEIKVPVIFVIGGPGSGKGTQCAMIADKYNYVHLSTGDLLREECASGWDQGRNLSEIMQTGQLVPDDVVLDLLRKAIYKNRRDANGFLVDGYPRDYEQAVMFEERVCPCSFILFFDVPDEVMKIRLLSRGRADDREDTIINRLSVYHANTKLILDKYGDRVKTVDAIGTPGEIFSRVLAIIENCSAAISNTHAMDALYSSS